MTILALDQSSKLSGYAVYIDGELKDFGHWSMTDQDIAKRIHGLCQKIQEKIEQYKPDSIVFENIQQTGGLDTFQKLSWVQGAIMVLCAQNKIGYQILYPTEWRATCNFLKGNDKHRAQQKKIAQEWCFNTYDIQCTDDEADAICIGHAAVHQKKVLNWA